MFKRPDTYIPANQYPAEARMIKGTDLGYLPVPGLINLVAIFMGTQEMPLIHKMEVPEDKEHVRKRDVEIPLVIVEDDPVYGMILLRSELSNDGIWQEAQMFAVCGEWESESEAKAEVKETVPKGQGSEVEQSPPA
jgi:hypothetical protein